MADWIHEDRLNFYAGDGGGTGADYRGEQKARKVETPGWTVCGMQGGSPVGSLMIVWTVRCVQTGPNGPRNREEVAGSRPIVGDRDRQCCPTTIPLPYSYPS